MPGRDLRLSLRLTADGRGLRGEVRRTARDVERLTSTTRRSNQTSAQASTVAATLAARQNQAAAAIRSREVATRRGTRADREATRRTREASRAARAAARAERERARAIRERLGALGAGLGLPIGAGLGVAAAITAGALAARAGARAYFTASDAAITLTSSLALVTESEEELARVRRGLIDISRGPYAGSLIQTAALYSRLTLETRELGLAEAERLRLIETIRRSAAIGGDGPSADAAVTQLLQGIGSGELRGEELRSVLEQAPGLSIALIEGFQTLREEGQISLDVTRANLRELAEDGELTADRVTRALLAAADSTDERYGRLRVTVGEQLRLLRQELSLSLSGGADPDSAEAVVASAVQRYLSIITDTAAERGAIVAGLELLNPGAALGADRRRRREQERRESGRFVRVGSSDPGPSPGLDIPNDDPGIRSGLAQARYLQELEKGTGRAREFLTLRRQLLSAEEQIQAAYQDSVELLREHAAATGESVDVELRAAAAKRDEELQRLAARRAAEAEAKARADGTIATREAVVALAELRAENDLHTSLLTASNEQRDRELEQRERILEIIREHGAAQPDVIAGLIAEAEARQDLVFIQKQQARLQQTILERAAASLKPMADVATVTTSNVTSTDRLVDSFSLAGESLRNITGAFGELGAQSRRAFRLQQAASLATAIVSTAEGVTRALAKDPPLSFILAATVAAAGAAQIAAIRAAEPPQAFRYGGIIDRRTEFSYGGGRRGVAGEAGLEAILPLTRTPRGELGVRSTGGGSRVVRIDVGSIVVQAPEGTDDPQEFGRAALEGLLHEARPLFRELLVDEQRPGGVLDPTDRVT